MAYKIKFLALLSFSLLITSCSYFQHEPTINHEDIKGDQVLGAKAETRFLISNKERKKRVFCAEPSPDIMKAVQESFSLGLEAKVDTPEKIQPQVAFALARARAESAAQLGERLATIQLLRDSLYRACEAYANGALGETAYAVLLSRYDDVMVTLLMGELAAGNFGRKLATLGGSAESRTNLDKAFEQAHEAQKNEDSKKKNLKTLREQLKTKENELKTAQEADQNNPNADHSTLKNEVEDLKKKVTKAEEELESAESITTFAQVEAAATASDALSVTQNTKNAEILARIQTKYIENINSDALVVACVTELSKDDNKTLTYKNESGQTEVVTWHSDLYTLCKGDDTDKNPGIIPTILKNQSKLLKAYLTRAFLFVDGRKIEAIEKKKKNINDILNLFACDSQDTKCPNTKTQESEPEPQESEPKSPESESQESEPES